MKNKPEVLTPKKGLQDIAASCCRVAHALGAQHCFVVFLDRERLFAELQGDPSRLALALGKLLGASFTTAKVEDFISKFTAAARADVITGTVRVSGGEWKQ